MITEKKIKLALFASGSGTNAETIIRYFRHHSDIEVVLLLSNNPSAAALEKTQRLGIPTVVFNGQQFRESDFVLNHLRNQEATHLVLAGFLWLVPANLLHAFPNCIINIHPALLPKFGGKGMYGRKVHEAVKAAGGKETGITIHEVNEHFDEGRILFQTACRLETTDTVEMIAKKVQALEHTHYPLVIERWATAS